MSDSESSGGGNGAGSTQSSRHNSARMSLNSNRNSSNSNLLKDNVEILMDDVSPSHGERAPLRSMSTDEPWQLSLDAFKSKVLPEDEMKLLHRKKTKKFYEDQNALVQSYEDVVFDNKKNEEELEAESRGATIAIYASFAVNVSLACAKVYAAAVSGSLAVIASAIDSFLDLLSGSILFCTTRALKRTNVYKYPAGKTRLEPIGVIVFASCMATATLQLLVNGVQILLKGKSDIDISTPTLVIIAFTIGSKFLLFLYCRLQTHSPSAMAYAQDHFNDIITNSCGLGSALLANYLPKLWFMDAVGGILMGLYIMVTWFRNGYEQVQIVSGKSADADFISKVTFLCWNHHPAIKAIDTVRAFHIATGFSVEIDIVLESEMPLRQAHDIGESLQIKLESWDDVERCFVHLDYETEHKPEHKWVGGKKTNTKPSQQHSVHAEE